MKKIAILGSTGSIGKTTFLLFQKILKILSYTFITNKNIKEITNNVKNLNQVLL